MKLHLILFSVIAILVWNSHDTRSIVSDKLEETSEFIRPETDTNFTFRFQ